MVGVVVDTHALVWYVLGDIRLTQIALQALLGAIGSGHPVGYSAVTVVELVYLIKRNRVPREALDLILTRTRDTPDLLVSVPVTNEVALAMERISRDDVPDMPDRIIGATALHLGVPLVSRDRKIRISQVQTVW